MAMWQAASGRSQVRSANNFSKGLTTELSPFFTDENAMISGYGWDFGEYPAIKTRKGMSLHGSTTGVEFAKLLTSHKNFLIRILGNRVEYNDPSSNTSWTSVGTYGSAASTWSSTSFDIDGQALILLNAGGGGFYFKPTSVTPIPQMPSGKFITSDNLRVYVANASGGKGDYIYYSGFQDAMDFTSAGNSGFLQFYTPSGGDITGIRSFGGSVWVFKKEAYGVIYHTGDATLAYRLTTVSDTIGCAAHKTIAEVGPYIVFMSKDDVYIGSGESVTSIGGPIKKFIQQIDPDVIGECFAYSTGERYYLFISKSPTVYPTLCFVYDLRFQCWLPYSATIPLLTEGTLFGKNSFAIASLGQVYKMDSSTTDPSGPIPWMIQSRPFDEGVKEAEKELWEMHILGRFAAGSTMTVQISPRDDSSEWYPVEYDPIGTNAATQNKNLIVPLDTMPLCNYYSYRLSGTGDVVIQEVQRYSRIQPVQY